MRCFSTMVLPVYGFSSALLMFLTIQKSIALQCGQVNLNVSPWSSGLTRKPRWILGGRKIPESNAMPWLVILKLSNTRVCTGSLIASNYVLTARHCSKEIQRSPLDKTLVGYGNVERNQMRETRIEEIFEHPGADLAVLKLKDAVHQTPVCLPEWYNADCRLAKAMVVAGFGRYLEENFDPTLTRNGSIIRQMPGSFINSAMWTNIEQLDRDVCTLPSLLPHLNIQPHEFCAGGFGHGSLDGDSGGPVMKIVGNRVLQVGVTARGFSKAVNHRVYDAGIYVNVGDHAEWIAKVTSNTAQFLRVNDPCNVY